MLSLKKRQSGFTIIELLIVIIVIGILVYLIAATYGGIQSKARNTTRYNDVLSLQRQLEQFYSQNGYYPSLSDMNSSSWLAANMKSLPKSDLIDPSNPTQSNILVRTPTAKSYAYNVTDSNGSSCEAMDTNCSKYTLTATYEGSVDGSTTYSKSNLD